MKEIFLLRHGNTGYLGRYIGASDVPLSPDGVEEICNLHQFIKRYHFDLVICSPLLRCRQTFENLNLNQTVIVDERIREINFGRWEKLTFDEIEKCDPVLLKQWASSEKSFEFPEGESTNNFISRVEDFSKYIYSLRGNRVLIITHGGIIRHLICRFLNLPYDNYLYFLIKSGKVTIINLHNNGGVLAAMNLGVLNG